MDTKAVWISPERLYLNQKGQVVGHKDPSKLTLLVAANGAMALEDAQHYGLVKTAGMEPVEPEPVKIAPPKPQAPKITPKPKIEAVIPEPVLDPKMKTEKDADSR